MFEEDPALQKIAEAWALDAVAFLHDHFDVSLDWSDGSVEHIEAMLAALHEQFEAEKPTGEKVFQFAKMFGSYIGEVFRRNHGATWGLITLHGQTFPGLKASGAAGLFWPWGRAQNRIRNGEEDNVWHYYQILVESNGSSSPPSEP
jgi:hypothetical protein